MIRPNALRCAALLLACLPPFLAQADELDNPAAEAGSLSPELEPEGAAGLSSVSAAASAPSTPV